LKSPCPYLPWDCFQEWGSLKRVLSLPKEIPIVRYTHLRIMPIQAAGSYILVS
jgi:hypothetical protein